MASMVEKPKRLPGQINLQRIALALAFFLAACASWCGVTLPACDGKYDGLPLGFYAITIGLVLTIVFIAIGVGVLTRKVWAGLLAGAISIAFLISLLP
jgi:hypothetical protein